MHGDTIDAPGSERRQSPRHRAEVAVRIVRGPDDPWSVGESVDLSTDGGLIRLSDTAPLPCVGDRVLASVWTSDEATHIVAHVVRIEHGADQRWYVGLHFDSCDEEDHAARRTLAGRAGPRRPGHPPHRSAGWTRFDTPLTLGFEPVWRNVVHPRCGGQLILRRPAGLR